MNLKGLRLLRWWPPLVFAGWKELYIFGLCGKVFFSEGDYYRGGFCEKCQKLPPCQTEPIPAGSKTDPLLAKAEPFSDSGSSSLITYLTRGKNCCTTAAGREEWENVRETVVQTPRSVKKCGEEVLQVPEQRIPCSPWWRPSWCRLSPAAHQQSHAGAGSCALKEAMTQWRLCAGAGSW